MSTRTDITTIEDIQLLIDSFYQKIKADDIVGYIFNDIANVNWEHHLPKMYAFWEYLLLGGINYSGNPIEPHFRLREKVELTKEHFDRWVALFTQNVDELFEGSNAEEAKNKARLIALTWMTKLTRNL